MHSDSRPFGFNLIGHASANAGLGVTLRNLAKIILDRGLPLAILDIDPGHGRAGHDLSLARYFVNTAKDLPYSINISTLSTTSLPSFIFNNPDLFTNKTLNVGYFWWELSALPEHWIRSLEVFDVLLAGSDFLYSTYSQYVEGVFHVRIVHGLALPPDIKPDRAKFGIADDEFALICILEPTSDPIRKNPFSAVSAFQRAFAANEKARLIIKINNIAAFAAGDKSLKRLISAAEADPRIRLFTESLPYADALSLYASCDVYVALHRAEGLGLGLIEAMLLGKPVIATSWSGNMSFMDHTNSCLTRYKLVPVEGSLSVYKTAFIGHTSCWAEPAIDDAANWMQTLSLHPDLCRQIGESAKAAISQHLRQDATAKWVDEIKLVWERSQITPPRSREEIYQKIAKLKNGVATKKLSYFGMIKSNIHNLVNRHLLWRFKNQLSGSSRD